MREELVRACDCRLVTGRGDGGDGSDGCEAGDGEERADCRLSYLVFDADSAEESRRRSVAATVKEALGVVEGDGSDGDDGGDGR